MFIDLTLKITREMLLSAKNSEKEELLGHLGTHFDVMDKDFPLEYTKRTAVVFDVSDVYDRDITIRDIDMSKVKQDMFVAFYTGFSDNELYGSKTYFSQHPQLTNELIDALTAKRVSVIGVDFAGIRRGAEHIEKDQYCADRGVFVVENLCNLSKLINVTGELTVHTYPMSIDDVTGLPCRVVAQVG